MAVNLSKIFKTEIGAVEISTDTRSIKNGDFFLPIVGANFDGHDYIAEAIKNGAEGAFCAAINTDKIKNELGADFDKKIIIVDDTLKTYHQIAKHYLKEISPKVIAITGSSGKTTTKEMMRHVLAQKYKVHYTHANFNNEIGVPKTILEMPADTETLVLEMGMRALGEIKTLSETAEPDIAIITNIGTAHIERLGSRENIHKAKLEILAGLKAGGLFVVPKDIYSKLESKKHSCFEDFKVKFFDENRGFQIKGLAGDAIHADANAVALVARELGVGIELIQAGLNNYEPGKGRGSFHKDSSGNLFIDDSYNANPDSVKASVNALVSQFPHDNKIIVLGKILESDPKLIAAVHSFIDELAAKAPQATETNHHPQGNIKFIKAEELSSDETIKEIKHILKLNKQSVVLVKGSRGAELEKVIEPLLS